MNANTPNPYGKLPINKKLTAIFRYWTKKENFESRYIKASERVLTPDLEAYFENEQERDIPVELKRKLETLERLFVSISGVVDGKKFNKNEFSTIPDYALRALLADIEKFRSIMGDITIPTFMGHAFKEFDDFVAGRIKNSANPGFLTLYKQIKPQPKMPGKEKGKEKEEKRRSEAEETAVALAAAEAAVAAAEAAVAAATPRTGAKPKPPPVPPRSELDNKRFANAIAKSIRGSVPAMHAPATTAGSVSAAAPAVIPPAVIPKALDVGKHKDDVERMETIREADFEELYESLAQVQRHTQRVAQDLERANARIFAAEKQLLIEQEAHQEEMARLERRFAERFAERDRQLEVLTLHQGELDSELRAQLLDRKHEYDQMNEKIKNVESSQLGRVSALEGLVEKLERERKQEQEAHRADSDQLKRALTLANEQILHNQNQTKLTTDALKEDLGRFDRSLQEEIAARIRGDKEGLAALASEQEARKREVGVERQERQAEIAALRREWGEDLKWLRSHFKDLEELFKIRPELNALADIVPQLQNAARAAAAPVSAAAVSPEYSVKELAAQLQMVTEGLRQMNQRIEGDEKRLDADERHMTQHIEELVVALYAAATAGSGKLIPVGGLKEGPKAFKKFFPDQKDPKNPPKPPV